MVRQNSSQLPFPAFHNVTGEVSSLPGTPDSFLLSSPLVPVPMSPWVGPLLSMEPLSPAEQVYSKILGNHLPKKKEAIVSLQLESHNLFFLKHLHSEPQLLSLQKIEESVPCAWTMEHSHAKLAELLGLKEMTVSLSF